MNSHEARVEQLLAEGKRREAIELLYELVVSHAKAKRFLEAERLRDRLIAIDPMALNEIVQSAEIIEAEKAEDIDTKHMQLWAELYDLFDNDEEKNAFFYALQPLDGKPGQVIIEQGKLNNRLFLVSIGILKEIVRREDSELFLRTIGQKEFAGGETFFKISVCTTSVIVEQQANILSIERKDLQAIEQRHPGIEERLDHYYHAHQKIPIESLLHKKEIERRRNKRHKTKGEIQFLIADKDGKPISNSIRGGLEDLSTGGASFIIKCAQKSTARLLLGRTCSYKLFFDRGGKRLGVSGSGVILGVHSQLFHNEYLVNLNFNKPMIRTDLDMLVGEVKR